MSTGKLDQSLDEIMKDRKPIAGAKGGRNGRLPNRKAAAKSKAATTAVIAPTGGVQKKTRAAKPVKTTATPVVHSTGDSKISVSNLPEDVGEVMIKEYFSSMVGPVKKVIANFNRDGRSRGSATVIFGRPTAAADAVKLDGTKVDGRAMRIELLMNAKTLPAPQPPKSLKDRVSGPKNVAREEQKKKAKQEAPKAATNGAVNGAAKGNRTGKKKSGRAGRAKPKTAEELDAEMHDYFGSGEAPATNGGAAPAATNGGDSGMVDEVM